MTNNEFDGFDSDIEQEIESTSIKENNDLTEAIEISDELKDQNSDEKMSIEELLMTDDELAQQLQDINLDIDEQLDYSNDDVDESIEEDFSKKIDSLTLNDMKAERERLVEMGALDGEEIARRYDAFMEEQRKQEQFDAITNGLSEEQLESLNERLQAGNEELGAIFGLDDIVEDDGFQKVKRR